MSGSGSGCGEPADDSQLKIHADGGIDGGEENHETSKVNGSSQKLTKEQLMDYVKKQKIKIKQLENKIQELQSQPSESASTGGSESLQGLLSHPHHADFYSPVCVRPTN
jgi:hypothetical protein